ncbi:DUF4365 domain-containing protein [Vibrio splendidus]|uniref:DUF4365 domain-containing protein n=1 Tax=Vibrio splendidus 12E03 TaxID=1191305 RepID=A0A1E5FVY9_VIBSP|nr:DUF4365 domain-containing protein [Vibrio splendidus]OEF94669.1 hypothetical protein A142_16350 [Vibrio splendidus 12E03]
MSRYNTTERIGINAVESVVVRNLGWIFRDQPVCDQGIDAHIEIVNDGNPTGKLLGVQVKSGSSHFKETAQGYVYYGSMVHLEYWLSYSLPVILVGYLPEDDKVIWAPITKDSIEYTPKNWKITIPKNCILTEESGDSLKYLVQGTSEEIKYRNLLLNLENMKFLDRGGRLLICKEDWINKSLSRGRFELIKQDSDGKEETIVSDFHWYTGMSVEQLVNNIYPWADVGIDEEYYDINADESFYSMYTDSYKNNHKLYPYTVECGEVAFYRLELSLNTLGNSFLKVAEYIGE